MQTVTKNQTIDIFRMIAAFLVVAIHALSISTYSLSTLLISMIFTKFAVPFFFIVSGFYISKGLSESKNSNILLINYIKKIIIIYLAWSYVYFIYDISMLYGVYHNAVTVAILYLRDFFLAGSHYHLWYFPALLFSVLFFYIFFKVRRLNLLYIFIPLFYLIGLFGDSYNQFVENLNINLYFKILDTLGTTRNGLFFGLPYFFAGYLIFKNQERLKDKKLFLLFAISFIFHVIETLFLFNISKLDKFNYNLFLMPAVFFLASYLILYNPWKKMGIKIFTNARNLSVLIYCFHLIPIIIISSIQHSSGGAKYNYFAMILLIYFFSLAFSMLLLYIHSWIKKFIKV